MKRSKVFSIVLGGVAGVVTGTSVAISRKCNQIMNVVEDKKRKMDSYYFLLNQWLLLRQEGKTLAEYFEQNNYKEIAIYGMKELGERLCDELKNSGVVVKYAIDKNAGTIYVDGNVDIVTPEEILEPVDVIVVTATYYFDEIEESLHEKVNCPIISLEDIVYDM